MGIAEVKIGLNINSSDYGFPQGSYGSHVRLLMLGEILNLVHNTDESKVVMAATPPQVGKRQRAESGCQAFSIGQEKP